MQTDGVLRGAVFFATATLAPRRARTETAVMSKSNPTALQAHWRRNRLLTCVLLTIWFAVILGAALYARELNRETLFGVPLGFYIFAQGAPILFLCIIGLHAWLMNRLDRRHAATQADQTNPR